jgi:DNA-binding beta-propeller fold protein YncE
MFSGNTNSPTKLRVLFGSLVLLLMAVSLVPSAYAKKKDKADENGKQEQTAAATAHEPTDEEMRKQIDTTKLQWPAAPEVARIKFVEEIFGEKIEPQTQQQQQPKKKKQGWMDKMAGVTVEEKREAKKNTANLLLKPYGIAVDSKGRIYTADLSVGAIFIFDQQKKTLDGLLKNGAPFQFKSIIGLAIDDGDRVFVSDSDLHQITAINKDGQPEDMFGQKELKRPTGLAIDNENRFVYVADVDRDQVAVFDADSFKFLRYVGGPPKVEGDDEEGTLDKPTNVAVDDDGYLYVSDTLNNRIQMFDADGEFVGMFGKQGVEPGNFARPKGVAIDGDGHIWVVDANQNRVQVFDKKGHLLAYFGGKGQWPGQFFLPAGICIDKKNRVIVSDQWHGRLQVFQYITDSEAAAQKQEKEKRREAAAAARAASSSSSTAEGTAAPATADAAKPAATDAANDKPQTHKGKMSLDTLDPTKK